jgi:demethylmenaquinone methyltransferase/2-methoxy-6-polyprenyl-1,4-benzoquinol methylase
MDHLPFADRSLGGIVQGFALRHCRDYSEFFAELHRVLRPGGQIAIMDMRYPRGRGLAIYRFYFRVLLPRVAVLLGGDREAYRFLVESVRSMPDESVLIAAMGEAGFSDIESRPGFLGSVRLLLARRPAALAGAAGGAYSAD